MPYKTVIESVDLKGWTGGLNRQADPFLLEPTEVPDAVNVDFGLRGEASKRKGYQEYTTDTSTATVGDFVYQWSKLGGSDFLVYVDDTGKLWYTSTSTLSAVLAGVTFGAATSDREFQVAFSSINDLVYVSSVRTGAAPHKFDGTTWSELTVSPLDGTADTFPRARALVEAHERVFAFNVKRADNTDFRSRMYYSAPLLPESWAALDYIDFSPDDGQEITGAALFGEQIIVFKNHSMFALAGTDESTFVVYPIDTETGTECPGTIVAAGPELFFFDHRSGVWSFDGTQYQKIDDKINQYLLDGINEEYADRSTGFAYRGRYYLSVPWGVDTVPSRTFVYDARIGAWTEYDFGFRDAVDLNALMYTVGPASKVGVYKMWLVDNDDGGNIAAHFATAWLSPNEPSYRYRLRRLDLAFAAKGNFNVSVVMRRDFTKDAFVTQTVNTSPGGALFDSAIFGTDSFGTGVSQVLRRTTGWGTNESVRWRTCQFEFSENTTAPFQINRMVMQVSQLGRLRGEP